MIFYSRLYNFTISCYINIIVPVLDLCFHHSEKLSLERVRKFIVKIVHKPCIVGLCNPWPAGQYGPGS